MIDADLRRTVLTWIAEDPDAATQATLTELLALSDAGDQAATEEIRSAFAGPLTFGTAGLGLCTCAARRGGISLCSSDQVGNPCRGLGGLGCCCARGGGAVFPAFAAEFQAVAADAATCAAESEASDGKLSALYFGGGGFLESIL